MEPIQAVEKVLEYMNSLHLSHSEATVVASYVAETLKYNSIKDSIKEEIKQEILEEIQQLKEKVDVQKEKR